jgi:hypothetical protein
MEGVYSYIRGFLLSPRFNHKDSSAFDYFTAFITPVPLPLLPLVNRISVEPAACIVVLIE